MAGKPMKYIYYRRFAADLPADGMVSIQTLEEHGAWSRLCDYAWVNGGVPDDHKMIARILNVRVPKAKKLWDALRPCFDIHVSGGKVSPGWLEDERAEVERVRELKSTGGRKGANKRWGRKIVPIDEGLEAEGE